MGRVVRFPLFSRVMLTHAFCGAVLDSSLVGCLDLLLALPRVEGSERWRVVAWLCAESLHSTVRGRVFPLRAADQTCGRVHSHKA